MGYHHHQQQQDDNRYEYRHCKLKYHKNRQASSSLGTFIIFILRWLIVPNVPGARSKKEQSYKTLP
eukprot:scaffold215705_cov25-Prasinocladus_malaysianus.AAC.1